MSGKESAESAASAEGAVGPGGAAPVDAVGATDTVEKVMSLSTAEFANSIAAFAGAAAGEAAALTHSVSLPAGAGTVSVTYEPLPGARLGGLLVLPRARVRLAFANVAASQRDDFLRRFDIAFQRGGG